jgi:hypothetical protein
VGTGEEYRRRCWRRSWSRLGFREFAAGACPAYEQYREQPMRDPSKIRRADESTVICRRALQGFQPIAKSILVRLRPRNE